MWPEVKLTTVFRRPFQVSAEGVPASLSVQGFHTAVVEINGRAVPNPFGESSQRVVEMDVGPLLKSGDNLISVTVENHTGPPAFWLDLIVDGHRIVSDSSWSSSLDGAEWLPARPVSEPPEIRPGNAVSGGESCIGSLRERIGTMAIISALVAITIIGYERVYPAIRRRVPRCSPSLLAFALLASCWTSLFVLNWRSLSVAVGFDSNLHLDYVRYILERSSIPLANEGLEMQQPPLYYVIAAKLLSSFGVVANGSSGCVFLLRAFGLMTGLIGIYVVMRLMQRLFPDQVGAQIAGMLLAACLPMQIYLAHYLSNDLLAATLGIIGVYLTVAILQQTSFGLIRPILLGIVLGAGILTKLTVIPIAVVAIFLLALTAVFRDRSLRSLIQMAGTPLCVCLLVSAWYFLRNYQHFGKLIVGTHDVASGFHWWQDPGFVDLTQFNRFGTCLLSPFYAAQAGIIDGLYSTCWGDGGWGGQLFISRPPWNYKLMAIGYLLALIPTVLFFIGWIAALKEWVSKPSAVWGFLLLLPLVATAAIVYHFTQYPFYCHVKAFYALPALAAGSSFVARGFLAVTAGRGSRWKMFAVGVALGVWGLTALDSFRIDPASGDTLAWIGRQKIGQGDVHAARQAVERAATKDQDHPAVRTLHGYLLLAENKPADAIQQFERAISADDGDWNARLGLCRALSLQRNRDRLLSELGTTIRLAPDCTDAYLLLAIQTARDEPERSIEAAQKGLRTSPANAALHSALGQGLLRLNEPRDAIRQLEIALQLDPRSVPALVSLAWIRSAHPDGQFRNGTSAVSMANQACELTRWQWLPAIRVLAAAKAESGDYQQAAREVDRLLPLASPLDRQLMDELKNERNLYRNNKPLRSSQLSRYLP